MFENYAVAIRISLVNHVSAGLATLVGQFAGTEKAAAALQKRMEDIALTARRGTYLFGAGAVLASPFILAIDKAAQLQKQMIAIQDVTHATTGEMNAMRGAIEKIAGQTMFSNIDVAKMAKIITTGTGLSAGQVSSILPVYARFADVQMLMKGTGYEQSVTDAIRLAHTAQHYDAPSLSKYLDLLSKASFIIPGGLGEVGHALKYSQGVAKTALGVDDQDMVLLTALLNRLGFAGSRGGTNLLAAMTRTIPGVFGSGLLKGKSAEALRDMDMVDAQGHSRFFRNGKFDTFAWMGGLSQFVAKEFAGHPEAIARQNIMKDFQHAFGVQGSRIASLLANPQALEQLRMIGDAFQRAGGVQEIQQDFANRSVYQQWYNAKTNFVSALTEVGMTLLPMVTEALKSMNTALQSTIAWITAHQRATKILAEAFLGLSAAMAIGGTILLLSAGFRGLGLALQFVAVSTAGTGPLTTGLIGLGKNMAILTGVVGKLGLAFGAGYAVGSLIWHFMEGTKAADLLGEAIARVFAFFGNKEAADAVAANGKSSGLSRAFDLMANLATRGVTGTIADAVAGSMSGKRATGGNPLVFHGGDGSLTIKVPVMLDKKQIASAITQVQLGVLNRPQTGLSIFDPTQSLLPAGGL